MDACNITPQHTPELGALVAPFRLAPPPTWHLVKKRRTEEENREFNQDWTESFAFICNTDSLPTYLICYKKLAHNKKSNLERHFTTKHRQFAGKYPTGDARKKAVEEL
ncbi:hypothetical protein AVEN_124766-1 [Araneus ventricosus]|uniref:SPIN-DOC-like zinc-finger domain-containing protein n=1 Tax=Araneus ventricosus TaxID=182803 RepID=A0A4Y2KII3_ARAVE|nr:hypothetical protein AVEN_124766-1 [Araneus ventricosus]